jgi:hypothetical protein
LAGKNLLIALLQARIIERTAIDRRISLKDHDYCYEAYHASQRPPTPPPAPAKIAPARTLPIVKTLAPVEDLSEMDKIANNVAMGAAFDNLGRSGDVKKKHKKKKDKKKKKKKKQRRSKDNRDSSSR